jgi:hypothetical protein
VQKVAKKKLLAENVKERLALEEKQVKKNW